MRVLCQWGGTWTNHKNIPFIFSIQYLIFLHSWTILDKYGNYLFSIICCSSFTWWSMEGIVMLFEASKSPPSKYSIFLHQLQEWALSIAKSLSWLLNLFWYFFWFAYARCVIKTKQEKLVGRTHYLALMRLMRWDVVACYGCRSISQPEFNF